ncbi:YndJ family protein [Bacillus gobiensis]|uniref:YndJ family protein n=2 Tax=Bacillus gobiensis TaxID=1441095 RepID=UPI003D1ADF3E
MNYTNGIAGWILFVLFLACTYQQFLIAETLVLASILIFVPAVMKLTSHSYRNGKDPFLKKVVFGFYPFAAVAATLAFLFDSVYFAAGWFLYTGLLALYGFQRLAERGFANLEETSIDAGYMYLVLGGFWFTAYVGEFEIMNFGPLILLLTAVHFHYSAFLLPIFNGLLGRRLTSFRRVYTCVTWILLLSPLVIAAGISFSRQLEFISVFLYTASLYVYGFLVLKTPFSRRIAKRLVGFSSFILLLTIFFSLIYSFGVLRQQATFTIENMIWIHGLVNAVGVIVPALVGWSLEKPAAAYSFYGLPLSKIKGSGNIGERFLEKENLVSEANCTGLVDQIADFYSEDFKRTDPLIKDFYDRTENYQLYAQVTWKGWFRPFLAIYSFFSKRMGQLYLPQHAEWEEMTGELKGVDSKQDGREKVRAWVRCNQHGEAIFIALYSKHSYQNETYMNVALPLPFASMTGILKPYGTKNGGLLLTSKRRKDGWGDEGIYLNKLRLPLEESFDLSTDGSQELSAVHRMWIVGLPFLTIDYIIRKKDRFKRA